MMESVPSAGKKAGISVVVTTCDEADYIVECLESVAWADEIVIVDLESTDSTVDRCRRFTDVIFSHPRVPVVELVRQFGIDKATREWVLVLDPDERVPTNLAETLKTLAAQDGACAYQIPCATWMFGRQIRHGGWGIARHIRFFRSGAVRWPSEVHARPEVDGALESVPESSGVLQHNNYRDISHFLQKLNRYTDMEAVRLRERQRPFHWLKLFYQPGKEFYAHYIKHRGYKDGLVGLFLALLMAFYTQVSYMKLWEIYDRESREEKT